MSIALKGVAVMNKEEEEDDNSIAARIKRTLVPACLFAIGFGVFAGAIGGFGVTTIKHGFAWIGVLIAAPISLIGFAIMIATFRKWPTLQIGEPITPRTRRQSYAMIALIVVAAFLPMLFLNGGGEGSSGRVDLYSNNPLPTGMAVTAAIIWLIGIPLLSQVTRRTMDEVEFGHLKFGETVGFRFFATVGPAWWLGFRGGVLPQPDVMILFVATLVFSISANLIRRL